MKNSQTTNKKSTIDWDALEAHWADEITLENQMRNASPVTYPSYN